MKCFCYILHFRSCLVTFWLVFEFVEFLLSNNKRFHGFLMGVAKTSKIERHTDVDNFYNKLLDVLNHLYMLGNYF